MPDSKRRTLPVTNLMLKRKIYCFSLLSLRSPMWSSTVDLSLSEFRDANNKSTKRLLIYVTDELKYLALFSYTKGPNKSEREFKLNSPRKRFLAFDTCFDFLRLLQSWLGCPSCNDLLGFIFASVRSDWLFKSSNQWNFWIIQW